MIRKLLIGTSFILLATVISPALKVSSVIGDGMVLQRNSNVAIWGWDAAGTEVRVAFREQTATAKAGADGRWLARVPSGAAGGPLTLTLTIRGSEKRVVKDVLVGEVWIAGGQSNMWWPLAQCEDALKEIATADFPQIRIWDSNTNDKAAAWQAATPQRTVKAQWVAATLAAAWKYPGVPYLFARGLFQKLGVPVGIVHIGVPGTEIQMHMSQALCETYPLGGSDKKTKDDNRGGYARLFNGMVLPVAPFTAKGFLWWQGEGNADRPTQYQ